MHASIHTCTHAHARACLHTCMHTSTNTHMHTHAHTRVPGTKQKPGSHGARSQRAREPRSHGAKYPESHGTQKKLGATEPEPASQKAKEPRSQKQKNMILRFFVFGSSLSSPGCQWFLLDSKTHYPHSPLHSGNEFDLQATATFA